MQAKKTLRIGSRGSMLALWQANYIKAALAAANPELDVEVVVIKTQGDVIQDVALSKIGDKGLFAKELELALLAGEVDLCVHSMKDMPTTLPDGLVLAMVPPRALAFDALVARGGVWSLDDLPRGARIGTGALRRRAQLYALDKGFELVELRGNLDTRMKKVESGELDAAILAAAGIHRLGWQERIAAVLSPDVMTPAVGQGALALEHREGDEATMRCLGGGGDGVGSGDGDGGGSGGNGVAALASPIDDICVRAERYIMKELDGGCQVPIGAYACFGSEDFSITAMVAKTDGSRVIRVKESTSTKDLPTAGLFNWQETSQRVVDALLAQGAREVLDSARAQAGESGSVAPLYSQR